MKTERVRISKELVAFAYVQEEYKRTGDITAGLMPIFAPIIHEMSGQIFKANKFSEKVQSKYGIAMRPIIAESLIPKFVEAGFLIKDEHSPNVAVYRCASGPMIEKQKAEDHIEELLNHFSCFAAEALSRQKVTLPTTLLKEGFIQRLMEMQFIHELDADTKSTQMSSIGKSNDVIIDGVDADQLELALDVLSAEFITTLAKEDPVRFSFLERMICGAMIADVVLTLQQPAADTNLSGLTVVLDGPLIMDRLDLNTPESAQYAQDLLDMLKSAHVKLITYKHIVKEIYGSIYAPLTSYINGEWAYGPLAARFQLDPTHITYARAVCDSLDDFISHLDINIVDAKQFMSEDYLSYCPVEVEDSIRNCIGPLHEQVDRRIRDASSIASVMRMRKGYRSKASITDSKYIFVTRNIQVALYANKCLFAKALIGIDDVPPCILDRQISCVLWLCLGGSTENLTRKKLLANCMDALYPSPNLISRVSKFLAKIAPSKAQIFEALMKDKRAQRCLIHKTLGYSLTVSEDNVEELLEEIKRSTAKEVEQEAQQRERAMREEHERQIAIQNEELCRVRNSADKLQEEKARLAAKQDEVVQSSLERACRSARTVERKRKALILLLYGLAVVAAAYHSNAFDRVWTSIISAVLAIFGFWFVPEKLFKRWIDSAWQKKFNHEIKASKIEDYSSRFQIDRNKCTVQKRETL
jgi:hypothetical protein